MAKPPPPKARRYTPEQKAEALAVYVEQGPRAAAKATSVSRASIIRWARAAGVETEVATRTAAATEAAKVGAEARRQRIREEILAKVEDLLGRLDEPHLDFKGRDAEPRTYPKPTAAAVLAYATSIGILIDKYRLEMGEVTGNQRVDHAVDVRLRSMSDEELDTALLRLASLVATPAPPGSEPRPS